MTTLEFFLIAIIWIGYGGYAASRTTLINPTDEVDKVFIIVFAPIVFLYRTFRGITDEYKM